MATSQEKKFASVVDRVLSDPQFAKKIEKDPEAALTAAGFKLTPAQRRALASPKLQAGDVEARIPLTRPLVRIITKGTKPAVQVAVQSVAVSETTLSARTASKKSAGKKR